MTKTPKYSLSATTSVMPLKQYYVIVLLTLQKQTKKNQKTKKQNQRT